VSEEGKEGPTIIGDVFIHPTATVHPSAVLGKKLSSSNVQKYKIKGGGKEVMASVKPGGLARAGQVSDRLGRYRYQ
jgi:hypothetical protein